MQRTQEYGLTYVASPDKTYVIEPKGGMIDYSMARKNPLKFYDNVMKQDIQEHSCAKDSKRGNSPLKYRTQLTKRAIAKVLSTIETRLTKLIRQKTLEKFNENKE